MTIGVPNTAASKVAEPDAIRAISAHSSVFSKSKSYGFKTAMGGGIGVDAFPIINEMNSDGLIDKYETRKVVFPAKSACYGEKSILKAVEFELLWLQSKRRYYSGVRKEDEKRIEMLEKRLKAN